MEIKTLILTDLRPDSNLAVKEMFVPMAKDDFFFAMTYDYDALVGSALKFTLEYIKINLCLPYVLKL